MKRNDNFFGRCREWNGRFQLWNGR